MTATNTATDSDLSTNSLSYTLLNPPAGAQIDANGVITWTPITAQAPSTNLLTTVVTDNGTPAVSTTNTFTVVVTKIVDTNSPVIKSITGSNGVAVITWSSITGRTYPVQYRQSLTDTNWTDLPPNVTATGATTSETDAVGNAPQRFYRMVLLDLSVPPAHPPINVSLSVSNGVASLTWNAVAGRTYKVHYKLNLTDTNWTDLLPTVTAAGATATKTDSVAGVARRFYQLQLLP